MARRIFGTLALLAVFAAVFASAPAAAKYDCCGKACFCRHASAGRGASCTVGRGGRGCGLRHPLAAASLRAPESPALPLGRTEPAAPPLQELTTGPLSPLGRPSAPPNDPLTPPPRPYSSLAA